MLTCRAVGRIMEGTKVIGYRMIRSDGKKIDMSRTATINDINMSRVENMRVIKGANGDIVIRGYGVNLLNLPVVKVENNDKYVIERIIVKDGKIVGYMATNGNNKKMLKCRDAVELITDNKIKGAELVKNTQNGKIFIIPKKDSTDFRKNAVMILEGNKVIDPIKNKSYMTLRARQFRVGGVFNDRERNITMRLEDNGFIVCLPDQRVEVLTEKEFNERYKGLRTLNKGEKAVSDYYRPTYMSKEVTLKNVMKPVPLEQFNINTWGVTVPR